MNKPNLETCTVQEACDYAVFKIVEQGYQCVNMAGVCAYKDGKGGHCVAGQLLVLLDIPSLLMSKNSIHTLIKVKRNTLPDFFSNNIDVLQALQRFHDSDKKQFRECDLIELSRMGISTDAPQYKQWVEMGDD